MVSCCISVKKNYKCALFHIVVCSNWPSDIARPSNPIHSLYIGRSANVNAHEDLDVLVSVSPEGADWSAGGISLSGVM